MYLAHASHPILFHHLLYLSQSRFMSKVVVILGANGALGRAVSKRFAEASWKRIRCDLTDSADTASRYVKLLPTSHISEQYLQIQEALNEVTGGQNVVHAVVNVGGGFRMEDAKSDAIFDSLQAMYSSSVESSVMAAHLAACHLAPKGLLVLPGAAAAERGTPWALTYGAMKAAVHHLVKSLGGTNGGLPEGARTVGIAPVMLDTPANRQSMPDADYTSWTPTEDVANKILSWAEGTSEPESGSIYKIKTAKGVTEYVKI